MADMVLPNARQLRFLVIDDQPFIRQLVGQVLRSAGVVDIENAANGAEAIEKLRTQATAKMSSEGASRQRDFACVITDFNMKPLNGVHVLKAIRTGHSGAFRETPVVILTAFTDDLLVAAGLALDANGFVVKPVSRNNLLARVASATSRKFKLKSEEEYGAVEVPEPSVPVSDTRQKVRGAPAGVVGQEIPDGTDEKAVLVPIGELREGFRVAADVKDPDGTMVVRKGQPVTGDLMQKFAQLRSIGGIADSLWVWR